MTTELNFASNDADLAAALKATRDLTASMKADAEGNYRRALAIHEVNTAAQRLWRRFQHEFPLQPRGSVSELRVALEARAAMDDLAGMSRDDRAVFAQNETSDIRADGIPADIHRQTVMRRYPALCALLGRHLEQHEAGNKRAVEKARREAEAKRAARPGQLVEQLEASGVVFALDGAKGLTAAPADRLDDRTLTELRDLKPDVIAFLSQRAAAAQPVAI